MALKEHPLFAEKMRALADEHQIIGVLDMNHTEPTITSIVYEVAAEEAKAGRRVGAVMESADGPEANAALNAIFAEIRGDRVAAQEMEAKFFLLREDNPALEFMAKKLEAAAYAAGTGVVMHFPDPRSFILTEHESEEYTRLMEAKKGFDLNCLDEFSVAYRNSLNVTDGKEFDSIMQKLKASIYGDTGNLDDVDEQISASIKKAAAENQLDTMYVPYGGLHFLRQEGDIDHFLPEAATVGVAENANNFVALVGTLTEEQWGALDLPDSLYLLDSKRWIDVTPDTLNQLRAELQATEAVKTVEAVRDCDAIVKDHLAGHNNQPNRLPREVDIKPNLSQEGITP